MLPTYFILDALFFKEQRTRKDFPADLKDLSLLAFTICNSLRLVACLPQIISAAQDRSGCAGVSCATWTMFLLANSTAAVYATVNLGDWNMAVLFAGKGLCCAAILAIVGYKRQRHASRHGQPRAELSMSAFDNGAPRIMTSV